jgi:hypothetical protein
VNNRGSQTVVDNKLEKRKWRDIKVGDMVRLENNEFVTVEETHTHTHTTAAISNDIFRPMLF